MNNIDRTDVVFVIEKSISLKRYLPELLEAYITPTISCFGGGLSEDSDVFFNQSSLVQYGAVFYGTELSLLGTWGQVESFGPTCSEREIFSAINNACYTCKNLTRQAFILEGLQAAVNLFEKMKVHSPVSENIQRCCILITQSTPMSNPWSPVSAEKVLLEIKRIGIQLSIISAHKLVELYRLFDAAGGDYQANPTKNYASKPQHLVLLNGVTLQERAVSPSLMPTYAPVTNVATPPTTMGAVPTAGPGPSPGPPVPGAATPSPGTGGGSPAPPIAGMVRPSVLPCQNPPNINPNPSAQVGMIRGATVLGPTRMRWPGDATGGYQGGANVRPGIIVNPNPIQNDMSNIQHPQPMPGPGVQGVSGVQPGPCQGGQQGMTNTNQRSVVWQGTLEWQDKKNDSNSRAVHQVSCKMTSLNVNGEPEVKAEGWSPTLLMQMIPKNILGSIGNTFFRNVKTVMFMPEQSPALEVLTSCLFKGYAGCVHVSHAGAPQQGDVKIIILLFSSEKKAYVGFIPVDQIAFVNKIKTVIQSARKGQLANPMMPPVTGPTNVPQPSQQQPQPQHPGMINPSIPIQTSTGTDMNVMSTQPPGMIIPQAIGQNINPAGVVGGPPMPQQTGTTIGNAGQMPQRSTIGMQSMPSDLPNRQPQVIRQQLVHQIQQRPVGSVNVGQQRMSTQNPGLRQLLQQQVRFQQQQQQVQHQQQQQQQQQQQLLMMQQQGIRPQLAQQGQQVLGQAITQQGIGQQSMGQQSMGQQTMGQQGIGQSIQDNTDFMVELL